MAKVTHIGGGEIPVTDDNNAVSWQKCKDCRWLIQLPKHTQDTGVRLFCVITGNVRVVPLKGGDID